MTTATKRNKSESHEYLLAYDIEAGKVSIADKPVPQDILKALIYCRVSSHRQVTEGSGLEHQEGAGRERCKKHDPPVVVDKVFHEP